MILEAMLNGAPPAKPLAADAAGRLILACPAPVEIETNLGAVAESATVYSATFDAGTAEIRQHTILMVIKIGAASAGESVIIQWSDDGVTWVNATPSSIGSASSGNASNSTSAAVMCVQGRVVARYLRARYINGATAQTALKIKLTAIAGV